MGLSQIGAGAAYRRVAREDPQLRTGKRSSTEDTRAQLRVLDKEPRPRSMRAYASRRLDLMPIRECDSFIRQAPPVHPCRPVPSVYLIQANGCLEDQSDERHTPFSNELTGDLTRILERMPVFGWDWSGSNMTSTRPARWITGLFESYCGGNEKVLVNQPTPLSD